MAETQRAVPSRAHPGASLSRVRHEDQHDRLRRMFDTETKTRKAEGEKVKSGLKQGETDEV